MPSKATLVELPDLHLMVSRADEFPNGIRPAWERLESKLASLKGRKFYGLTFTEGSQLVYYAGLEPVSAEEVAALDFPTLMIKGGTYARTKLFDWPRHADKIGEIFGELMRDFPKDPTGPTIEYYRSQSELHLLIPVVKPES
ncbi:GyrI-like domain-containing protein [Calidithermus chliarophilus]|uniref:GyrI-like domain-containing protein n=1 Tax=Calidithermus chliarophilus TaxID=52023 RepID=UPI0012F66299|nr:GyrI-like domain-containing protein [Calidithermus chliarophilus]